jgi:hypothetical protein
LGLQIPKQIPVPNCWLALLGFVFNLYERAETNIASLPSEWSSHSKVLTRVRFPKLLRLNQKQFCPAEVLNYLPANISSGDET